MKTIRTDDLPATVVALSTYARGVKTGDTVRITDGRRTVTAVCTCARKGAISDFTISSGDAV